VIGLRLLPLLVEAGHTVAGMTRSPAKVEPLRALGAVPVVCDVFDPPALCETVVGFGPEVVVSELTDLPDECEQLEVSGAANDRMRREGTRNLLEAATAAKVHRFLAQSIAWQLPGERQAAVEELERLVLEAGGVVLRYGQLYGPGTYFERDVPERPRVHVEAAAVKTADLLEAESGVRTITDS
jgi:nucleoside-diphosphate-sugar epimerase